MYWNKGNVSVHVKQSDFILFRWCKNIALFIPLRNFQLRIDLFVHNCRNILMYCVLHSFTCSSYLVSSCTGTFNYLWVEIITEAIFWCHCPTSHGVQIKCGKANYFSEQHESQVWDMWEEEEEGILLLYSTLNELEFVLLKRSFNEGLQMIVTCKMYSIIKRTQTKKGKAVPHRLP